MAFARWRTTVTDLKGNVIPNATIYVVNEANGSVPQLYADRDGTTALGNPFNADSEGFAYFHALGGAYRITATAGGFQREWRYVGIGTAQELDAGAFGENAGWDAVADTPADLTDYASEEEGFRVLVIDADGNGRAAVYQKVGAGDVWTDPIWITGVQGSDAPPNTLTIGTVTQTPTPEVTITGTPPNQVLNFGLVKGDTGDVTPEMIQLRDEAEDARDSALVAESSAASSADTATTQAGIATTQAGNASDSATNSANSAAASAASEANAATSAGIATTQADNAANSAIAAAASEDASAVQAGIATTQAGNAANSADSASASEDTATTQAGISTAAAGAASTSADAAQAAQEYAWEWSSNPEDDPVDDGTNQGYSAYHWAKKAELAAGGGVQTIVSGSGIDVDATDPFNPVVGLDAGTIASLVKADEAVPQEYLDDRLLDVPGSVPTPPPGYKLAYTIFDTGGSWVPSVIQYDIGGDTGAVTSQTLVQRGPFGVVRVGSPSADNDAVNLDYLNTALGNIPQGTVTSVGVDMPTGFDSTGPITTSGNIEITYASGYQGYTTAEANKLAGIESGAQVNTVTSVAGKTGAVSLAKADVGLGSVDNTSDANKPVSTAQQSALDDKVDISGDDGLGFFSSAQDALGNTSGQTIKPPLSGSNYKFLNNNGAFTLQAPDAGEYEMRILVHNDTGAGAITAAGFTDPDPSWEFVTDVGAGQFIYIAVSDGVKIMNVVRAY